MTTATRSEDDLKAAIRSARERGDKVELARLQKEYRHGRYTLERVYFGPDAVGLRDEQRSGAGSMMPSASARSTSRPETVELRWAAREDLRAVTDRICASGPHLEWGGWCAGFVDDRGHVVVEALRLNEIPPHSQSAVHLDGEAMAAFEETGRGRIIGDFHSHGNLVQDPVEPSEADFHVWRRAADALGQPYLGLILGAVDAGEALPRATFDSPRAPALGAWVAHPNGTVRRASLNLEPAWLAEAASKVRFRRKERRA